MAVYILRIRNNQNLFIANRYSSISCIKDKSVATLRGHHPPVIDVCNLTLTLAKNRYELQCKKMIISKNFCVFPFVKTSG